MLIKYLQLIMFLRYKHNVSFIQIRLGVSRRPKSLIIKPLSILSALVVCSYLEFNSVEFVEEIRSSLVHFHVRVDIFYLIFKDR